MANKSGNILTSEGRINVAGTVYKYEYWLKDHLGNTRIAFADANNSNSLTTDEITQVNDYYPFGLAHANTANKADGTQKYLYNGKELQEGTDWLDYGARFYDPTKPGWWSIDPVAELYYSWSPYVYVGNNPVKRIDPDGQVWNVVIGAVAGGAFEAGIQIAVGMAQGQDFLTAVQNVDLVDVGVAMVEGGLTSGGSITKSIAKKGITMAISEGTKTMADVTMSEGTKTVGGIVGEEKSLGQAALDFTTGMAGAKSTDAIVTSSQKAIKSDITSGTYSTLTKAEKNTTQTINKVVNNQNYEKAVDVATNYVEEGVNTAVSGNTGGTQNVSTFNIDDLYKNNTAVQDNTRVNIVYPIIQ